MNIIISDTSPVSNLIQVEKLDLLKELFHSVIIPPFVDKEIRALSNFDINIESYEKADWIKIIVPKDIDLIKSLEFELDRGECEAIALSKELNSDVLIIDERAGNDVAHQHGIHTMGLIGCLIKAKQEGIIVEVKPYLEELENTAGFYVDKKLKKYVYEMVNE